MDLIEQQDWLTALDERMIELKKELDELKGQRSEIHLGKEEEVTK